MQKIKIRIPALARARTVSEAARVALRSEEAAAAINRVVLRAGFRRYSPAVADLSPGAAAATAESFFATGSRNEAECQLEAHLNHASALADLLEDMRHSRLVSAVESAVREAVLDRFPAASPEEVSGRVSSVLVEELTEAIGAADDSSPLEALRGSEIVACYVPGLSKGGLASTMTSFWTDESSCLTVKPDFAFMRFLELANIEVPEWIDAVQKATGHRVDDNGPEEWHAERAEAWRQAACGHDKSRGALAKPARLVQAVDACYLGFTPLIAFNADAGRLCARDWSCPLSLKGGILGLHDFLNGSGDPVRFEQKVVIEAAVGDMMLGEGRSCDFEEVHGFVKSSFRSKVSDEPSSPSPVSEPIAALMPGR